jgi:hypothetical protein
VFPILINHFHFSSCNVHVLYKLMFSNKFDLFWTRTLFLLCESCVNISLPLSAVKFSTLGALAFHGNLSIDCIVLLCTNIICMMVVSKEEKRFITFALGDVICGCLIADLIFRS